MNARKENLETKARKAVMRIESKVRDINNVLRDLSMKLCYMIDKKDKHYSLTNDFDHKDDYLGYDGNH
jgi:hypothetical protein